MRHPPTLQQVSDAIGFLCDSTGKDPKKESRRTRAWTELFKGLDGRYLLDAAKLCAKESEYFPSPAKIIAACQSVERANNAVIPERPGTPGSLCGACGTFEETQREFQVPARPLTTAEITTKALRDLVPTVMARRIEPLHKDWCLVRPTGSTGLRGPVRDVEHTASLGGLLPRGDW